MCIWLFIASLAAHSLLSWLQLGVLITGFLLSAPISLSGVSYVTVPLSGEKKADADSVFMGKPSAEFVAAEVNSHRAEDPENSKCQRSECRF